jgi:2-hydroxymuconate-semialdehyde hydrolase
MSEPAIAPDRFVVDVAGSPVHVHELGSGPPVLLLHGSGPGTTGWGAWRTVAEALAARHRVIVPDQAGFGGTPFPGGAPDALRSRRAVWVDQARGVMAARGARRYAVVGHSMGGAVALALAAAERLRVTRVAAVASMGASMPLPSALDALWAARPQDDGDDEGARGVLSLLYHDPALVTDEAVRARDAAMRAGADDFAQLFPPPRERWVRDLALGADGLAAVVAPVLLVHGAHDRITPFEFAALPLLEQLRDARLYALARCGHVPALEHQQEFLRVLTDFLESDA